MMKRVVVVLLLLALGAGAQAQDGSETATARTAAGAQRFLARVAEQSGIVVMVYRASTGLHVNGGGVRWVAESDCASRLETPAAQVYGAPPLNNTGNTESFEALLARTGLPKPPYRIDWSKVTDLARTGTSCPWCGSQEPRFFRVQGMTLVFLDMATADRAEFAMKFLVEKCGIPADEGF